LLPPRKHAQEPECGAVTIAFSVGLSLSIPPLRVLLGTDHVLTLARTHPSTKKRYRALLLPPPPQRRYPFCFDRMRAIRKDIVYQNLRCATARELLLRCLGFTALASAVFEGAEGFEAHLNLTATKETLQSLVSMCRDAPDCTEAATVTIANAVYFLGKERPFAAVCALPPNVAGGAVGWAADLLRAHAAGNFVRFFRLADEPPSWLLAALLHRHLAPARASAIDVLHDAYATKPGAAFPLADLARFIGLVDERAAAALCHSLGLPLDEGGERVVLRKGEPPRPARSADGGDEIPHAGADVHPMLLAAASGPGAADMRSVDLSAAMSTLTLDSQPTGAVA
jgi:hypothetical protein